MRNEPKQNSIKLGLLFSGRVLTKMLLFLEVSVSISPAAPGPQWGNSVPQHPWFRHSTAIRPWILHGYKNRQMLGLHILLSTENLVFLLQFV